MGQNSDVTAVIFNRGELIGCNHRGAGIQVSGNKWLRFLLAWCWPPFALHLGKGSGTNCGGSQYFYRSVHLCNCSRQSLKDGDRKIKIKPDTKKAAPKPQETAGIINTAFHILQSVSKASNQQIWAPRPAATREMTMTWKEWHGRARSARGLIKKLTAPPTIPVGFNCCTSSCWRGCYRRKNTLKLFKAFTLRVW